MSSTRVVHSASEARLGGTPAVAPHTRAAGPARQSPWAFIPPNWFAAVMGTSILPIALVGLPVQVPGATAIAAALWVLAAVLLVAVTAATVAHHRTHPAVAASHRRDPVRIQFYGAPAMALMTVGAGALAAGTPVVGEGPALVVAGVLWLVGTLAGLATAVVVPARMVTALRTGVAGAFGGWLMPVVPPMVSAATGAALVDHLPAGQWQQAMLLTCLLCMGVASLASTVVIGLLVLRLVQYGPGAAAMAPTWFIVLGPLGQSVTALHHLGLRAPDVFGVRAEPVLDLVAACGVVVLGCALIWLAWAVVIVRQARGDAGWGFSLTWWSFTFPVGTVVTGTSGMAELTDSVALAATACLLFLVLLTLWACVATRTVRGVLDRSLLRLPATW